MEKQTPLRFYGRSGISISQMVGGGSGGNLGSINVRYYDLFSLPKEKRNHKKKQKNKRKKTEKKIIIKN